MASASDWDGSARCPLSASKNRSRSGGTANSWVSPTAIGVWTVAGSRAMTRVLADARGRAVHVPIAGEVLIRSTLNGTSVCSGPPTCSAGSRLGAEPDEAAVAGHQVHRRGADEGGHEGVGRVVVDLDRRAQLAHPAAVHDRGSGRPGPWPRPGRGSRRWWSAPTRCWNCLSSSRALVRSLASRLERLVQQEHVGVADHRPGQGDPLALAARELAGPAVQQLADAEQLGRPASLADLLVLAQPLGLEWKDDVLEDVLVRVQGV